MYAARSSSGDKLKPFSHTPTKEQANNTTPRGNELHKTQEELNLHSPKHAKNKMGIAQILVKS
jgi:hypothetical protein